MEDNKKPTGLKEISTIRNILLGEHIAESEGKYSELETKLQKFQESIEAKLNQIQSQNDVEIKSLYSKIDEKHVDINERLNVEISALKEKTDKKRKQQKEAIGQMFLELGKKLMEK